MLYYYLGETLKQEELPRSITKHERITAKRIFIIHEPIEPEYLEGKATIADYKGLIQKDTITLKEKALEVLSEREPLVGENLLSENIDTAEIHSPQQEDWSHDDQQDMTIMGIMENIRNMENMRNMTFMENIPDISNMVDMGDMSNMLNITDMVRPVEE